MPIVVRPVTAADRESWLPLFRGYRDFYRLAQDDAVVERVWSWLVDDAHEVSGLVAVDDGALLGIAHWRRFSRPSTGTVGIWLDDLYTTPDARGRGVGRALIAELQRIAGSEGRSVVRWITADDNAQAQVLYDDVATRTRWLTYDATPAV